MLVTKPAPDFTAEAVMGDNTIKEISLADFKGKKVVLFFYPIDFTFVWPTEIIAFDSRLGEFEKRNVQVLGCSIDSKWSHLAWKNTEVNKGGIGNIKYPLIADITKSIAREYGKKNITINAVAPGFIQTDMIETLPKDYLENMDVQEDSELEKKFKKHPNDLNIRYELAKSQIINKDYSEAINNLLFIIEKNTGWKDNKAKTELLNVFSLLGDSDPLTMEGRSRLSNLIFKWLKK